MALDVLTVLIYGMLTERGAIEPLSFPPGGPLHSVKLATADGCRRRRRSTSAPTKYQMEDE